MTDDDKIKIDILLNEYNNVSKAIRDRTCNNEKIIGFGLTVIAATFSIGLMQNIYEIFLFVPIAILWLVSYVVYLYTEVLILGGYAKHQEEKINSIVKDDCLKFEIYIAENFLHNKFANYLFVFCGALVGGFIIYICLKKVFCFNKSYFIYLSVTFVIIFIGIIIGAVKMFKNYNLSYTTSKNSGIKKMSNKNR